MRQEKSAGAVIYYSDSEPYFLVLKYPRYWGFAKGWIEDGESEEQAAKREIEEEAGLKVSFIPGFKYEQRWMFRADDGVVNKRAVFFLAEISREEAGRVKISSEHEDFKFLSFDGACKIMKVKDNKKMLGKAREFILELDKQKKLF